LSKIQIPLGCHSLCFQREVLRIYYLCAIFWWLTIFTPLVRITFQLPTHTKASNKNWTVFHWFYICVPTICSALTLLTILMHKIHTNFLFYLITITDRKRITNLTPRCNVSTILFHK
jgi:hypothetical protein